MDINTEDMEYSRTPEGDPREEETAEVPAGGSSDVSEETAPVKERKRLPETYIEEEPEPEPVEPEYIPQKGDGIALLLAGCGTFLPIVLVFIGLILFVAWLFFFRFI